MVADNRRVIVLVKIIGRADGINIYLDKDADFDTLRDAFKQKITDAKGFFANSNIAVSLKDRELSEQEEKILLDILEKTAKVNILFAENDTFFLANRKQADDNKAIFHKGGLRNGQSVRFAGSVIILGDANPGSEIIADGNVVVLGACKGMVHAGASGDETAFVYALSLQPTQLRISNIMSYAIGENKNPVYVYLQDGKLIKANL